MGEKEGRRGKGGKEEGMGKGAASLREMFVQSMRISQVNGVYYSKKMFD